MRLLIGIVLLLPLQAEVDTAPLEAWLKNQADVRSLQAEFVQERSLPALKKPVTTPGTFRMQRPGKLRWELGKPVKTLAVSDGATMTLVDVAKNRTRRIAADSARARPFTLLADAALGGDLETFRKSFELIESRTTNGIYQLTTRPRDRSLRRKVSWLFLDIDPTSRQLRAFEIRLDDRSRIRTVFSNTRINPKIEPELFQVDAETDQSR